MTRRQRHAIERDAPGQIEHRGQERKSEEDGYAAAGRAPAGRGSEARAGRDLRRHRLGKRRAPARRGFFVARDARGARGRRAPVRRARRRRRRSESVPSPNAPIGARRPTTGTATPRRPGRSRCRSTRRNAPVPRSGGSTYGRSTASSTVSTIDRTLDVAAEPDRLGRRDERGERCHARYHCVRHDVGNGNRYGNDDRGACRSRDHQRADVSGDRHVRLAHRAVVSGARNPNRDIHVRRLILRCCCVLILSRILAAVPDPCPVLRKRSRRRSHGRYHGQIRLRQAVPLPGPRLRIVLRGRGRGGGGLRCRRRGVRAGRRARCGRRGRRRCARAGTGGARCRRDGRRDVHLRDRPVVARAPDPDADVDVGRRGLHRRRRRRRRRRGRCGDTSRGIGRNRRGIGLGWCLDRCRLDRRHGLDGGRSARCGGRRGVRRRRLLRRLRRLAERVADRALDRGARLPREHRAGVE